MHFRLYDELYFTNRPATLPLAPVHMAYMWDLWGAAPNADYDVPPLEFIHESYVGTYMSSPPERLIVLDIESWPQHNVSEEVALANVAKWVDTLRTFKRAAPSYCLVAPYNTGASPAYPSENADAEGWRDYQRFNDIYRAIAEEADFLVPSTYRKATTTLADWQYKMGVYLEEYRRVARGKPVILNTSPEVIDDAGEYISGAEWRAMLEFARDYADGMILWTKRAVAAQQDWNESADWWQETLAFLETL